MKGGGERERERTLLEGGGGEREWEGGGNCNNHIRQAVGAVRVLQNTEMLLSMNNIEICRTTAYDCIKDTSKITHSIIHEHKYKIRPYNANCQ